MQRVQFYAFTPPTLPEPDVTPYIAAFKEVNGGVTLTVRGKNGAIGEITLPVEEALRLSISLGAAKFAHAVVADREARKAKS